MLSHGKPDKNWPHFLRKLFVFWIAMEQLALLQLLLLLMHLAHRNNIKIPIARELCLNRQHQSSTLKLPANNGGCEL